MASGITPHDFAFGYPVEPIDGNVETARPTTAVDSVNLYAELELKAHENDEALTLDVQRTFEKARVIAQRFDEGLAEANSTDYSESGKESARANARATLEEGLKVIRTESAALRKEVEVTDQKLREKGTVEVSASAEELKAVADQIEHLDLLEREAEYGAALTSGDTLVVAAIEKATQTGRVFREIKETDARTGQERVVQKYFEPFVAPDKVAAQQLSRGREKHPQVAARRDRLEKSANIGDFVTNMLATEGARRAPSSVEEMTSNA